MQRMKRLVERLSFLFVGGIKTLRRVIGVLRRFAVLLVLLAMLAFNVASFTIAPLTMVMSDIAQWLIGRSVVAQMSQEASRLKSRNASLSSDKMEMRAKNRKLTTDLDRSQANLKRTRTDLNTTRESLKKTRVDLDATQKNLTASRAELQKAEGFRKSRAELDRSTRRIAQRVVRGAGRNVAAVPMEVVPVVGAATIIAVTALDIKEACDTVNDMQDLRVASGIDEEPQDWASQVCGSFSRPSSPEVCEMTVPQCREHAQDVRERLGNELADMIVEQCDQLILPNPSICRPPPPEDEPPPLPPR